MTPLQIARAIDEANARAPNYHIQNIEKQVRFDCHANTDEEKEKLVADKLLQLFSDPDFENKVPLRRHRDEIVETIKKILIGEWKAPK
jgi:hypothetical protein